MATLYFDMKQKQRITIGLNDAISFENFYSKSIGNVYSGSTYSRTTSSMTLSNIMSFISQINTNKELLLSFYGLESGGPRYVYNVHQKTPANTYKETGVLIVFREMIYNSKMFFSSSSNNISLDTIHKYTQFLNLNLPEQTSRFKKSIRKLINYIAWSLQGSLAREFEHSTIVVDLVAIEKISQDTFMLTSKIFFTKKDFVVFNLYLNVADKTKNKLVITKITEE